MASEARTRCGTPGLPPPRLTLKGAPACGLPLDTEATIVGRGREAHVRVDDPGVSRAHACFSRVAGDRYVVEAMRHPAARCLSHPTGRLINHRPPNALDLEEVFRVALATGLALEVNGLPDRLDLRDDHVRLAIEAGVPIVCSTDAHSVRGLGNMQLSVATARRGGATAADVLNTRPLQDFVT